MDLRHASWRVLATAAALALSMAGSAEAGSVPTEDDVKIAFLYQFTRFVEWPSTPSPGPQFVVAMVASEQFCALAERALSGKTALDRPVVVRRVSTPADVSEARILFVGATEAKRLPEILQAVEGSSVLTIGEAEGFAERGGMIGFRTVDNRVRFDINVERASRSRLRISSEVLKLARLVRTKDAP